MFPLVIGTVAWEDDAPPPIRRPDLPRPGGRGRRLEPWFAWQLAAWLYIIGMLLLCVLLKGSL